MDVVLLVDGVDGEHHLSHVELGHVLRQTILKLTEQSQQVSAHVVIHHKVLHREHVITSSPGTEVICDVRRYSISCSYQVVVVLESVVQCGDPLTVSFYQDVAFFSETGRLHRGN